MDDERRPRGDRPRPPDLSIAADVSARRIRFGRRPEIETSSLDEGGRTSSSSSRENLPNEVEVGRNYRDVRVSWRLASFLDEESEQALERRARSNGPAGSAED